MSSVQLLLPFSSHSLPLGKQPSWFCDPHYVNLSHFVDGFYANFVKAWQGSIPLLPGLAADLVDNVQARAKPKSGMDLYEFTEVEKSVVRGIALVAERAQINESESYLKRRVENKFHNVPHSGQVTVMAHYTSKDMYVIWRLLKILAALGHDVNHPGRPNIPGDILEIERGSFEAIQKLMKGAGMSKDLIQIVEMMLYGTSINGPAQYLKRVIELGHATNSIKHNDCYLDASNQTFSTRCAAMQKIMDRAAREVWEEGQKKKMPWANEANKDAFFANLKCLDAIRDMSLETLEFVASLHGDDIFPSMIMGAWTSDLLTQENRLAGLNMDFTTSGARMFFVGDIGGRSMFVNNRFLRPLLPAYDHIVAHAMAYKTSGIDTRLSLLEAS